MRNAMNFHTRSAYIRDCAIGLTRWNEERSKQDAERKPGYQERDMPRAIAGQKQLGKVCAVLTRNSGYERAWHMARSSSRLVLGKDTGWLRGGQ